MALSLIPICHASLQNAADLWPFVAGGVVGCVAHCVCACALCLSGGTALGATLFKSGQVLVSHLAPALVVFGSSLFLLGQEFMFNV